MQLVLVRQRRGEPDLHAIVDDDLAAATSGYRWRVSGNPRGGKHARTDVRRNGKQAVLFMHHLVLPAKPGFFVDHINRNSLDNRRANLRYLTPGQSAQNRSARKHSTEHRGVSFDRKRGTYYVHVRSKDGCKFGHRKTAEEAAAFASEMRRALMPYSYEGEA